MNSGPIRIGTWLLSLGMVAGVVVIVKIAARADSLRVATTSPPNYEGLMAASSTKDLVIKRLGYPEMRLNQRTRDIFQPDRERWEYRRRWAVGNERLHQHLTVLFENGRVAQLTADPVKRVPSWVQRIEAVCVPLIATGSALSSLPGLPYYREPPMLFLLMTASLFLAFVMRGWKCGMCLYVGTGCLLLLLTVRLGY